MAIKLFDLEEASRSASFLEIEISLPTIGNKTYRFKVYDDFIDTFSLLKKSYEFGGVYWTLYGLGFHFHKYTHIIENVNYIKDDIGYVIDEIEYDKQTLNNSRTILHRTYKDTIKATYDKTLYIIRSAYMYHYAIDVPTNIYKLPVHRWKFPVDFRNAHFPPYEKKQAPSHDSLLRGRI